MRKRRRRRRRFSLDDRVINFSGLFIIFGEQEKIARISGSLRKKDEGEEEEKEGEGENLLSYRNIMNVSNFSDEIKIRTDIYTPPDRHTPITY